VRDRVEPDSTTTIVFSVHSQRRGVTDLIRFSQATLYASEWLLGTGVDQIEEFGNAGRYKTLVNMACLLLPDMHKLKFQYIHAPRDDGVACSSMK